MEALLASSPGGGGTGETHDRGEQVEGWRVSPTYRKQATECPTVLISKKPQDSGIKFTLVEDTLQQTKGVTEGEAG